MPVPAHNSSQQDSADETIHEQSVMENQLNLNQCSIPYPHFVPCAANNSVYSPPPPPPRKRWWRWSRYESCNKNFYAFATGTSTQKKSATPSNEKKQKRIRTAFTKKQIKRLEKEFAVTKYVDGKRRLVLAQRLDLDESAIKTWFQNRRTREKRNRLDAQDRSTESC